MLPGRFVREDGKVEGAVGLAEESELSLLLLEEEEEPPPKKPPKAIVLGVEGLVGGKGKETVELNWRISRSSALRARLSQYVQIGSASYIDTVLSRCELVQK